MGKTRVVIQFIGIAQVSLGSDKSLLRCDYQQESVASLASMRNVGSDLKQMHGKVVISAQFSPKKKNGKYLIFHNSLYPPHPPVKLSIFSSCKGDPENYFARARYSQ